MVKRSAFDRRKGNGDEGRADEKKGILVEFIFSKWNSTGDEFDTNDQNQYRADNEFHPVG